MIAVTAYISTDVAAAPLLWVLPLALYLLTFVAMFRDRPWFGTRAVVSLVPFAVAPLAIALLGGDRAYFGSPPSLLNLVAFSCWRWPAMASSIAAGPQPAPADGILSVDLVRRRDRRHLRRPARAAHLQPHLRISDPVVAALLALPGAFAGGAARIPVAIWPALLWPALAVLLLAWLAIRSERAAAVDCRSRSALVAAGRR